MFHVKHLQKRNNNIEADVYTPKRKKVNCFT